MGVINRIQDFAHAVRNSGQLPALEVLTTVGAFLSHHGSSSLTAIGYVTAGNIFVNNLNRTTEATGRASKYLAYTALGSVSLAAASDTISLLGLGLAASVASAIQAERSGSPDISDLSSIVK